MGATSPSPPTPVRHAEEAASGADDAAVAELMADYQRLRAQLEALERTPFFRRARERRRILYLPAGHCRSLPGELPLMDFIADDRMAGLLNVFAVTIFDDGLKPYLDLMHQHEKGVRD